MGTNYYAELDRCPHCGRGGDDLHIGKSSAGWCFALATYPKKGINYLSDWESVFEKYSIIDEYGCPISKEEMLKIITEREHGISWEDWDRMPESKKHLFYDAGSEQGFHNVNSSERGPKGLLRHQLSSFCVGHGEGTWDYMSGEFS